MNRFVTERNDGDVQSLQIIYPCLYYAEPKRAMKWLCEVFGFEQGEVSEGPGNTIWNANLSINGATVMLGSVRPDDSYAAKTPAELGGISGSIFVYVADPDAHCAKARASGAQIVTEPFTTGCGSREYAAIDCEGNLWAFGTYRP